MFNNLVESSSHLKEFKRRGSFLLFTSTTYVVLFAITGVVSIFAYDAHLEEQNLEIVTLLPPQEIVSDVPDQARSPQIQENNPSRDQSQVPERAIAMASINQPEAMPDQVSTERVVNLPLPPGPVRLTGRDWDPTPTGGTGSQPGEGRQISQPTQVVIPDEPPPAPTPAPAPKILRVSEILNSKAMNLPKPPYPQMAKIARVQGKVVVQVLIDESGKVISAKALDGPPLLIVESQRAAFQARFSPTLINGQPVKVSGVITYNFVLP